MLRIIIILLLDNFENELYWAKNNQISLFDYSKIFQLKMKNIIKLKSQMLQKKNDFPFKKKINYILFNHLTIPNSLNHISIKSKYILI